MNGKEIQIQLNDGSSEQISVDFYNRKGIYGSRKGFEWDNIQQITFDGNLFMESDCSTTENACSTSSFAEAISSIPTTIGHIIALPIQAGTLVFVTIYYYLVVCTTGECNP